MNDVARAVQGLVNRPTSTELTAALGISAVLLLIAMVLLFAGRRRIGLGLGIVGLMAALATLVIVDQQTITLRESESVTVIRPRYREKIRALARVAMIALPGTAGLAVLTAWAVGRRRLRRSIPGLMRVGRMHLFLKEYEPALAEFSRAIHIAPYLAEAYSGRGAAYCGLGDVERALADFNRAIQYDPRLIPAFIQRARLRTESGDFDGALEDLNRVMELHPSDPEIYLNRGICFAKKGLPIDAAADFHRVLKLTNHSDFAEPAKDFLRQLEGQATALPFNTPTPSSQSNGVLGAAGLPEPEARDHTR